MLCILRDFQLRCKRWSQLYLILARVYLQRNGRKPQVSAIRPYQSSDSAGHAVRLRHLFPVVCLFENLEWALGRRQMRREANARSKES